MEQYALKLRTPRALGTIAVFVVLVIAVGGVIGVNTTPDAWYAALNKAPFNPPNWVFGPVWLILYVLIGIAGGRTFLRQPVGVAMGIWASQMLLNWVWSPIWFRLHAIWPAFAVIAGILALIIAFIVVSWKRDRTAALLFVPYAAWVSFASLLNLSAGLLN